MFCPSDSEYERTLKRTTIEIVVDMAAWFGKVQILIFPGHFSFPGVFLGISVLSLAELLFWLLRAFSGGPILNSS